MSTGRDANSLDFQYNTRSNKDSINIVPVGTNNLVTLYISRYDRYGKDHFDSIADMTFPNHQFGKTGSNKKTYSFSGIIITNGINHQQLLLKALNDQDFPSPPFITTKGSNYTPNYYDFSVRCQLQDANDLLLFSPVNGQSVSLNFIPRGAEATAYAEASGANTLNELTDVTLTSPQLDQVLSYDGTEWINKDLPAPIDTLNALTDVTLGTLVDGEALVYNGFTTQWENKDLAVPKNLDDLNDVTISAPSNGQALIYNGTTSQFENTTLPSGVTELANLTDVDVTGVVAGDGLVYDGTKWVDTKVILQDGNTFATDVVIGSKDANDVQLISNNTTKFTVYSGTDPTLYVEGTTYGVITTRNTTTTDSAGLFLRTGDTTTATVKEIGIVAGSTQSGVGGTIQLFAGSANLTGGVAGDIELRAGYGVDAWGTTKIYNDNTNYLEVQESGLVHSTVPSYNTLVQNAGDLTDKQYVTDAISTAIGALTIPTDLNSLTDVTLTTPANGQALIYNGTSSQWENTALPSGVTTLSALTDVDVTGVVAGDGLVYDGTKWKDTKVILQNGNTFATDVVVGSTDANDLQLITNNATKVTIDAVTDPTVFLEGSTSTYLLTRDSLTGNTANMTIKTGNADIIAGSILIESGVSATDPVNDSGQVQLKTNGANTLTLEADGTVSVNKVNYETLVTLPNDIPNKQYVDDAISGLTIPTNLNSLTDVTLVTPINNQALVYNGTSSQWENVTLSIPTNLDSLTDVVITTAINGQILKYNGTNWINTSETIETASNVNVAGVGVFKQKTGNNFEFRGINAGSAKITVTNDTGNNEIDIDLGTVNLDDLGDVVITTATTGQVVKYNGTNWVNTAETIETASNVNVAGVGVFKQKTGNNFEFRGINAGSAKITVTNDTGNNEIDVDLGTVNLDDLADVAISGATTGQLVQYNGTNWVNSNLLDSTTVIGDNLDPTKRIQFQLSSITTGTIRTYTAPNADGTLLLDTTLDLTAWKVGGNTVSADSTIGTLSNFAFNVVTNNVLRAQFSAVGGFILNGIPLTSTGATTIRSALNTGITIQPTDGSNAGGTISIKSGNVTSPNTNGSGAVSISSGTVTSGSSGTIDIFSANTTSITSTSGAVNLSTGSTTGNNSGGIRLNTGNALNTSGSLDFYTGTSTNSLIGKINLTTGGSSATGKGFQIENDGTLSVLNTVNYHTLVTADNDMPNLKAVKDNTLVLTNKSLSDTTTTVQNVTDPTKLIKFDVSSVTTATTRTYKANNSDGTLVLSIPTSAEVKMDVTSAMDGDSFLYDSVSGTWKNRMMSMPVGELYYENDTGATITLTTQNTWYLVNPPDTLESNNSAFPSAQWDNPSDGRLRYLGTHTQAFHTAFSWSSSTANAGDTWEFAIFKNGVQVTGSKITSDFTTNNVITSFAFHKVVSMTTNDYIELYVRNISQNNRTMIFRNVNLVAMGTMGY